MGILQQVAATMRRLIGRRDNYAGVAGQGAPGGFAGAGVNRLTVSLSTWAGSVNYDLDGGNIGILRARARQLAQSNEHGKRFLTQVATNVVGRKGPMLQVRATVQTTSRDTPPPLDKAANDAVEIHYARWAKRAEITGKMSLAQALRVTAKSCARDGEALIRLVRDRSAAYGLQIQLLEIDRLDDRLNRELPDGDIRQGVERDTAGRPRAYWLLQRHPGENYGKTTAQYERVPASDIIHAFLPERAEQVRGYTWFHAVLLRAAQLHGYNEAAVLAARIGASKVAALERPDDSADLAPTMADGGGDGASTSAPLQMNVEAGEMFELPPGYKLNSWNPDYPHANYESFVRTAMHGLASGLDVAEHNLSGDMTGVNYSSARIAELSEREVWMMLQDWFIDSIVQPIYSEWLAIAMLRGDIKFEQSGKALPADKLAKFANASRFQGRRWKWTDPSKEIDANAKGVELGVTSRTRIAAEQGDDFEDVLDELRQETAALRAAGLPTTTNYNAAAAQSTAASVADPAAPAA